MKTEIKIFFIILTVLLSAMVIATILAVASMTIAPTHHVDTWADKYDRHLHIHIPGHYGGKWWSGSAGAKYRAISWKNGKSDTLHEFSGGGMLTPVDSLKPDGRLYIFKDKYGDDSTYYSPDSIIFENIEP
jgi:hypothetical protein